MKAYDIVGYQYQAAYFHPECMVETLIDEGRLSPGARSLSVEDALDQLADVEGIDRMDEFTFDSGDFPKVVFAGDVGGFLHGECCDVDESCDRCLVTLV